MASVSNDGSTALASNSAHNVGGVPGGTLVKVSTVTAQNVANALGIAKADVGKVEQALNDEFQALHAHFAMAVMDVKASYDQSLTELTSLSGFAKANKVVVGVAAAVLLLVGGVVGHFV